MTDSDSNNDLEKFFPFLLMGAEVFMGFALQWLDFLKETGLGFYEWEDSARILGGIIGVVIALLITVENYFISVRRMRVYLKIFVTAFVLLILSCLGCQGVVKFYLSTPEIVEFVRDSVWFFLYSLSGASLIAIIASTSLLIVGKSRTNT